MTLAELNSATILAISDHVRERGTALSAWTESISLSDPDRDTKILLAGAGIIELAGIHSILGEYIKKAKEL